MPDATSSHANFVHLRVHSAYSLLEGAIQPKDLVSLSVDARMPSVAVTDTNNLFGALEFSFAAADKGVQPIIGCQLSLERTDAKQPQAKNLREPDPDQIVLLVQNDGGYRNLLKLFSRAYLESDDAEDPKVTIDDLKKYSEGLILLTGGVHGPVGRLLLDGQNDDAKQMLEHLSGIFSGNIYVELQRHGLRDEDAIEGRMIDLAYELDIPLVATNEVFFSNPEMFDAQDALICVAAGAYVSQEERRRLSVEHYFKSANEMTKLFADVPEAIANTLVIAKRCAFMVPRVDPILPPYDCGEGLNEEDELRKQSRDGLEERLRIQVFTPDMDASAREKAAKPYRERLEYELDVIIEMGFSGYFLIVSDFIKWAKTHNIPVGPGRGSGAGSVVAWSLSVTDLDPLRWGLLFERFLNPERVSMPDFDIDFCQERRDEVIRYVQEKYGRDHVAQIITFGKLQARAVLRDVGRVLEMPYGQVDRICKLVPNNPAAPVTLPEAITAEPQLREMIRSEPEVKHLVDMGQQLEGLYRHASTHAAGVVIGDRPLSDLVPVYRDPRSDMPVTGFNMKYVEQAGLVKFDFLGLKTLTVLATAVNHVAAGGVEVDLLTIPLDDPKTFEMFARAETQGVFQLESAGMKDVLRQLRADKFEDIIAVVALYRPGPMENIPSYIKRKHGEEEPDYLYPTLEPILRETFGIMIYQEQVMQIAQELSGYSLGSADLLRRAMGKKIQSEMDEQRATFVEGAKARGVDKEKSNQIFDQVNKFAGYGFNKSHAAAYALVAYQTGYMKANFPVEFMAASMTLDLGNTDKLNAYRQELERMGIDLLPPDINLSEATFKVERDDEGKAVSIRYALAALKNVGEGAMEELVAERDKNGPFKNISDFAKRVDAHQVNKRQMENLIRAGSFDAMVPNRRQLFNALETLLGTAQAAQHERESGQIGLFGGDDASDPGIRLPDIPDFSPMDKLKEEFDALGFYLSAHPLDSYSKSLKRLEAQNFTDIMESGRSGIVSMAGTVISKKERISAKGNRYAFVQFSDTTGAFEAVVFSDQLAAAQGVLEPGQSLFIRANAQFEGGTLRLSAQSLKPLDEVASQTAAGLNIIVDNDKGLDGLKEVLASSGKGRGRVGVIARIPPAREVKISLKDGVRVTPELLYAVRTLPGIVEVQEI